MLELIVAVVTGWLAFETDAPSTSSFLSFVGFFILWTIYFIVARAVIGFIITAFFNSKN
jgi:hypothetical protein